MASSFFKIMLEAIVDDDYSNTSKQKDNRMMTDGRRQPYRCDDNKCVNKDK